jgi:hypothetical protein
VASTPDGSTLTGRPSGLDGRASEIGFEMTSRTAILACLLALGGAGCAAHAGSKAASGALQGVQEQSQAFKQETGNYMAQVIAQRTMRGALDEIQRPEQFQWLMNAAAMTASTTVNRVLADATAEGGPLSPSRMATLSSDVAQTVEQQLARTLARDLGPGGEGPLGRALAATSGQMSGAVARGMVGTLLPGCTPGDADCIDRRIAQLGQGVGAGLARGALQGMSWLLVAVAFLGGVITTVLLDVTWHLLRRRSDPTAGAPRAPRRPATQT